MAIQLLNGENIITETKLMGDTLILTDKRLIYQNIVNPNSDTFTGLQEIAGINSTDVSVTNYRLTGDIAKTIYRGGGVTLGIIFSAIISFNVNHTNTLANFTGTFLISGIFTIGGSMMILYLLINIYLKSTSSSQKKLQVIIKLNNGEHFLNRLYDSSLSNEIIRLQNQLNNIVFNK